ncbi:UDP-N-acetylmuramoyl-L-alanyl-D-glutamate--2,6-diaminopimelate ligase [Alkalicoccus daliensis]|uniref:UDP-N-acetylmuramoyl-L-alanyl-D-glutamate--2,6-diaminopimelate ligase n=1 Tax=Alkalicoccus daliensis TaxID=745820 RepID=A0A1G9ZUU8_9BACI|nr:UDP-N-acetylmuramoyl-L-alanyl-D-glutamate--2,6-diaminopimelate ligase [Alkalicoccus daliensis]SDN24954.1 UDP-N-acetylmuramoylalanyl-D-glutamate--2,6-diaminopimelate ligase [Alkalicoccus daliensis]
MKSLHNLADNLPLMELSQEKDVTVYGMKMDHREIEHGDIFFCVPGFTVDGHNFAEDAVKNGAAALVTDRWLNVSVPVLKVPDVRRAMALLSAVFYEHPSSDMHLIGVTGTNGKTSVTHFIEQMLAKLKINTGIIGTMYTKYNEKIIPSKNTTPESLILQQLLAEMRDADTDTVAMEVSSHSLANGRIHGTQFNTAIFTNLSQDHLDYHVTMKDYARAKSLLFAQLGSSFNRNPQAVSIINIDDEYADIMMEASAAPVITYGMTDNAMIRAENVRLTPTGSVFKFSAQGITKEVSLKLPGRFSVYNALAAAAALYVRGYEWEKLLPLLSDLTGVSGRFEPVMSNASVHVIVDYAHTPDSLQNVLETIKDLAEKKIYVVVGCGGDRDKTKRPVMAGIAERYADFVYLTSDNPRTEDPALILDEMAAGVEGSAYEVIEDRKEAIYKAVMQAGPEDVILIAGKGHETYQEIGKERFDFNDKAVAEQALKEWK